MTQFTEEELLKWHKGSFANKGTITSAQRVGCFCCCATYPSHTVVDFVEDKEGETALCPQCSVDSVIVSEDQDLLSQMCDRFFRP